MLAAASSANAMRFFAKRRLAALGSRSVCIVAPVVWTVALPRAASRPRAPPCNTCARLRPQRRSVHAFHAL